MMKAVTAAISCVLLVWACMRFAFAAEPVRVGVVYAQTGMLADLAVDYWRGLELWRDAVNARGGMLGRPVEVIAHDDRSEASATARAYEQLIADHRVQVLIGPFGSSATRAAAVTAERARRVLVNATGAAAGAQRESARHVFQVAAPYAAYGETAYAFVRAQRARSVFVLAREDARNADAARAFAARAKADAALRITLRANLPPVLDAAPLIERARAADADAWVAFVHARDAAELVKAFRRAGYAPQIFIAAGAAEPAFTRELGQDAEFSIAVVPYRSDLPTGGNAGFAATFQERWSVAPSLAAAQGYAAGLVLEEAVARAGSFDQEKLRVALGELVTQTPLGEYRVDPADGRQLGARPLLTQVLKGRHQVVWPASMATRAVVLPYPQWNARTYLGPGG